MAGKGRPRQFDRDQALQAAMLLFWRKGYQSASMNDLCQAMGVFSPSIYAAFGGKEAIYIEAVELYTKTVVMKLWGRLDEGPTARAGMKNLLLDAAQALPKHGDAPCGCMVTLASADEDAPVAISTAIRKARRKSLDLIRARLDTAVEDGELPRATDTRALSRFYLGTVQGMAVQARDGATPSELKGTAEAAMLAWPGR
jgi:AcrR family transcriptional regulator